MNGLFVGTNNVVISHLQFVDDALFVGEWSAVNATNLLHLLRCFGNASGLNINLSKSKLFGIGAFKAEVIKLVRKCNCKAGELPFLYLGLPVGEYMKLLQSRNLAQSKFRSKLCSWMAKTLSICGRYNLVKSILNSFPVYYLSLFRAPVTIIKKLELLRNKFFWGEVATFRKIIWAKSSKMYGEYAIDGLQIGSLAIKNLALLEKWWWRFHVERTCLWSRLISSIYGADGSFTTFYPSVKRAVWPTIVATGREIEANGVIFADNLQRVVGRKESTKF